MDKKTLIFGYILRNALLPIVTVMGSLVVSLLTGTLVIEDMFAVPGIGSFMGEAILENDYNVVLALSFIYAMIYVVVMLGVDLIYGILDPRIRIAGKAE
jgi:oligopeptide transport system permease protein